MARAARAILIRYVDLKWGFLSCSFIFCIPDQADACEKENSTEHPGKYDRFYIPGAFSAIHETNAGIDQSGNSQQG